MAKKKVKAKSPAAKADEPSFEHALAELDQIVARLEGGQLGLEAALAQYELGVRRLQTCYRQLADAERRIELVSHIDPQGRIASTSFDEQSAGDLADKAAARSQRRSAGPPRRSLDDEGTLF
ncbi:MAG: exodeoxyribonuclease VII small subunit [Pirellulales bacterium]|nr:exodeoxyribonuclease VII small subunit [Pirellulales bacterium]